MAIIFLDDWKYYPTATLHLETTNKSWVRLVQLYKKMGIKNHAFPLALINPELRHIDPTSDDLTPIQVGKIVAECLDNPWYFFREVLKAPAMAGAGARPFQANRGNIALFWLFFNHITLFLIQPRQTGKSFSTDGLMMYLMNIACKGTMINLLTKDDNLRRANIQRLKDMREELPIYLQVKSPEDSNNTEEITVKTYGNRYVTHVPQMSPKRAINLGRGLTSEIFHIDEPPFQPNIAISLPAALAAGSAARDIAKEAGTPWGTIFTTTAGKKDDKDGRYVYRLVSDSAIWSEQFLDARNIDELYALIKKNSPSGEIRVNCTFSHRQLGKSDLWLAEKLAEALQEGLDADRDFFNVWTSGSESSPFSPEVADLIAKRSLSNALYESISNEGYIIRWYVPEEEIDTIMREDHMLALDTSEAAGRDDISFVLLNVRTLKVTAAGTFNETNLILFSQFLTNFIVKHKKVTTIIERRSTGGMILDYLLLMLPQYGEDPFRRLYNRIVNEADEYKERFKEINVPMHRRDPELYVKYKKAFGWATSGSGYTSRSELYGSVMQTAIKKGGERIYDQRIVNQLLGLVIKNGRIDHADGDHDDMVIGWLLSHWMVWRAKQLSFYGIDTSMMAMETADKQVENLTPHEAYRRREQYVVRQKINELIERIKKEQDQYVAMRLEAEVRALNSKVILEEGEIFSVDALLRDIKERKVRKTRDRHTNDQGYAQRFDRFNSPLGHTVISDKPMGFNSYYR